MLGSLFITQLQGILSSSFSRMRSGKKTGAGKKVLIALLAVYVIGMMLFSFGAQLYAIAQAVAGTPQEYLVPLFGGGLAVLFAVMISVLSAEQHLFRARDNELLLSMPIPPRMILLSRLLTLWVMSAVLSMLITLPLLAVWCIACTVTAAGIAALLLGIVLLPVFALAVVCLLAWLSAWLSDLTRVKNLGAYIIIGLGLAAYLWIVMRAADISRILSAADRMAALARRWLPPAYRFAQAVSSPSPAAFAAFLLWCIVPMAAVLWLLSANLVRLITSRRAGKKAVYREKAARVRSPFRALTGREFRRLLGTPIYLVNCCFGVLLEIVLAVVLLVRGPAILEMLRLPDAMTAYLPPALLGMACFMAIMTATSAVSISLEGRTFPLLRSLPVSASDVLRSKLALNLLIGMPPLLLLSAAAAWTTKPGGIMTLLLFLLPQLTQIFAAVFGLYANLTHPLFDWTNETAVVKQSGSMMIAVLGGMGVILLGGLAAGVLSKPLGMPGALALISVVMIFADAGITAWLFSAGLRRYEAL